MKNLNLSFLNNITDEDKILLNQIAEWAFSAENRYLKKFSFFLDERQISICDQVLKSLKYSNYRFYGGYEYADRKILCVYSEYDKAEKEDFPIIPLAFKYNDSYELSHRDFLGSLMSLNISRNTVGDIIVGKGCAQVFVFDTVSDLILSEVSKIGRVGVNIESNSILAVSNSPEFKEINGTVASLRLDCIVSLALHISREKAKALIISKNVAVNHVTINGTDTLLNLGDVFSIHGYGKFILKSLNGVSKKNRFHVTLNKYV